MIKRNFCFETHAIGMNINKINRIKTVVDGRMLNFMDSITV